jgi:hypothetical protein
VEDKNVTTTLDDLSVEDKNVTTRAALVDLRFLQQMWLPLLNDEEKLTEYFHIPQGGCWI